VFRLYLFNFSYDSYVDRRENWESVAQLAQLVQFLTVPNSMMVENLGEVDLIV
jgi:hypothetical protein